jgi:predicted RNA-binding protein YlqC (UPF0109 family)
VKDLVEFLAKSLVDSPDEVKLQTYEREQASVIELEVAHADLGKVIGRQGRTARAIRTILSAAGQKTRRRFVLDIVD